MKDIGNINMLRIKMFRKYLIKNTIKFMNRKDIEPDYVGELGGKAVYALYRRIPKNPYLNVFVIHVIDSFDYKQLDNTSPHVDLLVSGKLEEILPDGTKEVLSSGDLKYRMEGHNCVLTPTHVEHGVELEPVWFLHTNKFKFRKLIYDMFGIVIKITKLFKSNKTK